MLDVSKVFAAFKQNGIDFYAGVPDSLLKNICAYITDNVPENQHIIAVNEGAAIGLAAGHFLASGHPTLVYMQNSGIGNAVNPLLSLCDVDVYSIPVVLLIGWRGEPEVKDEPQHKKQGKVTLPLLEAMGVPYEVLSASQGDAEQQIAHIVNRAMTEMRPVALVVRKDIFGDYKLISKVTNDNHLTREKAMKSVIDAIGEDAVVVSTTGKLSREIFEYRETIGKDHSNDFLTVGSMGHSSSIALSIALEKPKKHVYCLDGDGALLMHLGSIATIGVIAPSNYTHILFNNGSHESVGKQPTIAYKVDLATAAKAMGYKFAFNVNNEKDIALALQKAQSMHGPGLIEIRVNTDSRADLGRPTTTPIQNRTDFMNKLNS